MSADRSANTGGIFDIAQYEGFFAKNGLKINAIAYAGGPPAVEALLAGRAKIASFAPSTSIETWQTANPLVTVAFTQNAAPQYAIVSKKFLQSKGVDPATFASLPFAKRVAYLKGTVWGTHAIGGLIDHYTDILVAIGGLSPKAVTLDALGTPAADEASFKGGRVNAIWVDQVTEADFVKNDDAVNIFDPTDPAIAKLLAPVELSSGGSGWILSKKWADANTATLDKFLNVIAAGGAVGQVAHGRRAGAGCRAAQPGHAVRDDPGLHPGERAIHADRLNHSEGLDSGEYRSGD